MKCEELQSLYDFIVIIDKKSGKITDVYQKEPFDFIQIKTLKDLDNFWKELLKTETEPIFVHLDSYIIERVVEDNCIIYTIKKSIHLQKYIKELKDISLFDSLTKCYTKRYLIEFVEKAIANYERYKSEKFSLIIFDIDFFKKVNDTYGHLCGDKILKSLAQIINNELRTSDMCARFGGEEFVVVLPNTKITGALKLAERIRNKVENFAFQCEKHTIPVTVSLGVTSVSIKDSYLSIIKRADDALYTAKESGRNKVEYN